MTNEINLPGKFVSDVDQLLAATETVASQIRTYYASLINGGIPLELAGDMTAELSRYLWTKILGLNACDE